MKVIPSVDIKGGRCVKLVQGRPGTGLALSEEPVRVAEHWVSEGAEWIHVVDLDGALTGFPANRDVVLDIIRRVGVPVQVGGGVRTVEYAKTLVEAGAGRVVVGTVAYERPELLNLISDAVGSERVVVALDVRSGMVVKRGWTVDAGVTVYEALRRLRLARFWGLLYTDVNREGLASGVNLEALRRLVGEAGRPVLYAGGVASLSDIAALRSLGVYGVVVGRALYEGLFTLREAVEVASGG